jgi:thiamine biosynthesis lipoprotein
MNSSVFKDRGPFDRLLRQDTVFFLLTLSYVVFSLNEFAHGQSTQLQRFESSQPAMGSLLSFVVYAVEEAQATSAIHEAVRVMNALAIPINNYDPSSEVSRLESTPPQTDIPISTTLADVLHESSRWHELSRGAFDSTTGSLIRVWREARKEKKFPDGAKLEDAKKNKGWENLKLSNDKKNAPSLVFKSRGMAIDLSGIATGFLLDAMMESLHQSGIRSALINAGGDIIVGDPPPNREGWSIDIAGISKSAPALARLSLRNCSVTTSGDLYQFIELDGVRYSHLIHPQRGEPITRRQSVTVVAKRAIDADAGATAVAVLGPETAFSIMHELPLLQVLYVSLHETSQVSLRLLHDVEVSTPFMIDGRSR